MSILIPNIDKALKDNQHIPTIGKGVPVDFHDWVIMRAGDLFLGKLDPGVAQTIHEGKLLPEVVSLKPCFQLVVNVRARYDRDTPDPTKSKTTPLWDLPVMWDYQCMPAMALVPESAETGVDGLRWMQWWSAAKMGKTTQLRLKDAIRICVDMYKPFEEVKGVDAPVISLK